jgi:hypothetical protein
MTKVDKETRSAERVAANAKELDEVKATLGPSAQLGILQQIDRVKQRDLEGLPELRISVVARLLDLSVPTTRTWAAVGILEEVKDSVPKKVTTHSVLSVRPHILALRELGKKRGLLQAVLDRIDDEELLDELRQNGSLDFKEEDLVILSPRD